VQPAEPAQDASAAPPAPPRPPAAAPAPAPPAAPAPAPAPPDTSRTKPLADKIVAEFPTAKVDYVKPRRVKITVSPAQIKEAAIFVRDALGFDHLNVVGGTDYIALKEFEVIYFVGSLSVPGQQDLVVQLAERLPRDDSPTVPSLVEVWTGAEYHERETFEMLGIVFEGHPDLRRLLLPEDWNDIPPLRKDYVSPGR
jgi:NADH:ubiquinone oxidoreductase subunit C